MTAPFEPHGLPLYFKHLMSEIGLRDIEALVVESLMDNMDDIIMQATNFGF